MSKRQFIEQEAKRLAFDYGKDWGGLTEMEREILRDEVREEQMLLDRVCHPEKYPHLM